MGKVEAITSQRSARQKVTDKLFTYQHQNTFTVLAEQPSLLMMSSNAEHAYFISGAARPAKRGSKPCAHFNASHYSTPVTRRQNSWLLTKTPF